MGDRISMSTTVHIVNGSISVKNPIVSRKEKDQGTTSYAFRFYKFILCSPSESKLIIISLLLPCSLQVLDHQWPSILRWTCRTYGLVHSLQPSDSNRGGERSQKAKKAIFGRQPRRGEGAEANACGHCILVGATGSHVGLRFPGLGSRSFSVAVRFHSSELLAGILHLHTHG